MTRYVLRVLSLACLAGLASAQAPFNDSWETAQPIGGGAGGFFDTIGATQDGSSNCDVGSSRDVWFVYTPETAGIARFQVRPSGLSPTFDLVLSVHELDAASGDLVLLACDDETGNPPPAIQAEVMLQVVPEVPLYVRVTGKNDATGGFQILVAGTISQGLPPRGMRPPNASPATPLPIWPGDYRGYTRFAPGPPSPCLSFSTEDAWFTYVPKVSGAATVRTDFFAQYDSALDIEENGSLIQCVDSSGGGEVVSFPVQGGAVYSIRVASADGSHGIYGLRLTGPDCVGQTCTDAEPIAEGTHVYSMVGAAPSGSSSCSPADPDRYFTYTAPAAGTLNVSTCETTTAEVQGYAIDARISLHSACPADGTTELDCSKASPACTEGFRPQPFVSTPVTQGQQILIRVSARAEGQRGPIRMEVSLAQSLSVCFGDGSGAACPCGNMGGLHRGCDNSLGTGGARLFATGSASVSADTLSLVVTDAPRASPLLLLQGDAVHGGGGGTPFADGLMCVDGSLWRLAGGISVEGASVFGSLRSQSISLLGGMPAPGATRWYQGYYRNPGPFCTASPANLTNAVRVTWTQ